ncbi:MGMT family protein [Paeniglutamicibacter sp. R2-26]|uniref:MGMT family protein n=1 Tax=Paeniglutamicibacter sp. R2-26 TaxID=3144417 RepID=UPI003EE4FF4E
MVQSSAVGQQENGSRPHYEEAVLEVAALIPSGRVLSYGDIAELLGSGGPRQVGKAMSRSGSAVCWWRVLRADGSLPAELNRQAEERWLAEGTPRRGSGVHMKTARWEPDEASHRRIDEVAATLPIPKRRTPLI